LDKNIILTENKNKSGIYRWVNKLNNNTYVGSGLNLSKRVGDYYKKSELNSLVENRYFSSTNFPDCFPVKSYENADTDKFQIINENRNKAGIYRWVNLKNGKTYIGSSVDLGKRLQKYYNYNYLIDPKRNMIILKTLIKYGYSNFKVEILEFCNKDEVLAREQYYLDLLKPEYNILTAAGSSLGYKHLEETKVKMKTRNARNWTEEQKAKWLEDLKRLHASEAHKEHMKKLGEMRSIKVEIFDTLNNETSVYPSTQEAAKAIGVGPSSISMAFKRKGESTTVLMKNKRYQITKLFSSN
jgi:group I intron endonuclease